MRTKRQKVELAALRASTVAELLAAGHGLLVALGKAGLPSTVLAPAREGVEVVHSAARPEISPATSPGAPVRAQDARKPPG